MCFGKKPKPEYASSGGYSQDSIRPLSEKKYAHASVSSVSSVSSGVSVFGGHEHYPSPVPAPPPRQYYDYPSSRPISRQSQRSVVPNFSSPQPHQHQNYPRPMSQQSSHPSHPQDQPQFSGPQGPFPPPQRANPLQPSPHLHHHHRGESRPSPLAPNGHKRQQKTYEHVHRKIQGAQGPGIHGGTKLHPLQTMYVGGW